MTVHKRQWGQGRPVIALHPLGLESSGFAGFGKVLAKRGIRTTALDLPGFGQSPAPPNVALKPALLAEPVIARARAMREKPVVIGISLGGRVALEAALTAPETFHSVIAIAPYMPWRRHRIVLQSARLLRPGAAAWMPLERIWPQLRWLADTIEKIPYIRDDELAQSAARFVYYAACPATRASFLNAARELALDPAFGEEGLWTRLPTLPIPAAFVWGERDGLVSSKLADSVRETLPTATQVLVPCASHFLNGPHHRCIADGVARLLEGPLRPGVTRPGRSRRRRAIGAMPTAPCFLEESENDPVPAVRRALPGVSHGR
jgi:pimeloyl-[acyl-carrier protein] methyl ester esterase